MAVRVEPDWSAVELADGASDVPFNKDVPFLPPLQIYSSRIVSEQYLVYRTNKPIIFFAAVLVEVCNRNAYWYGNCFKP